VSVVGRPDEFAEDLLVLLEQHAHDDKVLLERFQLLFVFNAESQEYDKRLQRLKEIDESKT
jgi:hypothetical protein